MHLAERGNPASTRVGETTSRDPKAEMFMMRPKSDLQAGIAVSVTDHQDVGYMWQFGLGVRKRADVPRDDHNTVPVMVVILNVGGEDYAH